MDLCLTFAEGSLSVLTMKLSQYARRVAYIEVRLDYLEEPAIPELPAHSEARFIATCRPPRQGGRYAGEERARLEMLRQAARSGFSYIDLESDVREDLELPESVQIVRSVHYLDQMPEDLGAGFESLAAAGGDVLKLATAVHTTEQLVRLLDWMATLRQESPWIVLGMGEFGRPSRLLGALLGNHWTYVSETSTFSAAPGQPTLEEASGLYRFPERSEVSSIYGVLGNPVSHSLSPLIHNRLFAHYGMQKIYFPFPLDNVDTWLHYVNRSGLPFHGFSVTLPFKTDVAKFVRKKDSPVNALNTLTRRDSCWEGANTDYEAFLKPLRRSTSLTGKAVLVLGNGGVAHTVVKALQNEGAEVMVVGRDLERVSSFAQQYGCRHLLFSDLPVSADICINTTPVGQHPRIDESPMQEDQLDFPLVYDLIYHPEETTLLRMARRRGVRTISGLEMFVEQGALQFEAWTGISPDRSMMQQIIRSALS